MERDGSRRSRRNGGQVDRDLAVAALRAREPWDLLVIGGGATGLGVALDARTRGLHTLLVDQGDFASATSSKSTKLIHGGVRYLPQGRFGLVRQSLRERAILLRNAPDLVRPQSFLVPAAGALEGHALRTGLWIYELLERLAGDADRSAAGVRGRSAAADRGRSGDRAVAVLPHPSRVSAEDLERSLPNLVRGRFSSAFRYFDAQFDDAGLALRLAQVFVAHGGIALNYARVERLIPRSGQIRGAVIRDLETDQETEVGARCVVNAAGIFVDSIRRMDDPALPPLLAHSRGSHLVLDLDFLTAPAGAECHDRAQDALVIPRTTDGRVLFAVPWSRHLLVGTTDIPVGDADPDPRATEPEIEFLLQELGRYLRRAPGLGDVRSTFAGIRPLLQGATNDTPTKRIAREHRLELSARGLLTIAGGKWTTYRLMAAHTVDRVLEIGGIEARPCVTATLPLRVEDQVCDTDRVDRTMVQFAVRQQMARTVEDVLARRSRCLLLDVRQALGLAEPVARWMAEELDRDDSWIDAQVATFDRAAARYLPPR